VSLATAVTNSNAGHKRGRIFPCQNDPSHFTGPTFGDLPAGLPEANEGALEGGFTGTNEDTYEANVAKKNDRKI